MIVKAPDLRDRAQEMTSSSVELGKKSGICFIITLVNFMGNFRGINPLLADVWATFLGNSSVVLRVPTYLHKQTRDYVDSGDGLQDSITVTQTHNLTSLRPADPSQNTLTPLSITSPL